MNLAMQMHALADVVERQVAERPTYVARQQSQGQRVGVSDERCEARAVYQGQILALLSGPDPVTSAYIGQRLGVERQTAFHRLSALEKQGLVLRIGTGVKTKWSLRPCKN